MNHNGVKLFFKPRAGAPTEVPSEHRPSRQSAVRSGA